MICLAQYAFLAAHIPLILANHVDQARAQVESMACGST